MSNKITNFLALNLKKKNLDSVNYKKVDDLRSQMDDTLYNLMLAEQNLECCSEELQDELYCEVTKLNEKLNYIIIRIKKELSKNPNYKQDLKKASPEEKESIFHTMLQFFI
jgi:hypothetical protein